MKLLIHIVLIALFFASCNSNTPIEQKLIGTWSEPYHVNDMVKSMTFYEDGTVIYSNKPDTTWNTYPTYGGNYARLNYAIIENGKLRFSGYAPKFSTDSPYIDTVLFAFVSDFRIKAHTLTIDSFAYDGGTMTDFEKTLKLKKI